MRACSHIFCYSLALTAAPNVVEMRLRLLIVVSVSFFFSRLYPRQIIGLLCVHREDHIETNRRRRHRFGFRCVRDAEQQVDLAKTSGREIPRRELALQGCQTFGQVFA